MFNVQFLKFELYYLQITDKIARGKTRPESEDIYYPEQYVGTRDVLLLERRGHLYDLKGVNEKFFHSFQRDLCVYLVSSDLWITKRVLRSVCLTHVFRLAITDSDWIVSCNVPISQRYNTACFVSGIGLRSTSKRR